MRKVIRKPRNVALAVCCLAAVGVFTWKDSLSSIKGTAEEPSEGQPAIQRPVPTATVESVNAAESFTFPASVRARRRVELGFSVAGLLEELHAVEGKSVAKGTALARLDPRDFQHALDAALAVCHDARRAHARAVDLYQRKVISKAKFDTAKTAYDIAAADLKQKQKALADTVMRAPFDGIVAKRYVENREHVKERSPIISYADLSMIEVVTRVPERVVASGGIGRFAEVAVQFDADQDRWFTAAISEYSIQSDPVSQTYEVVTALEPPTGIEILPGMTATVKLGSAGADHPDAGQFLVPVEAVVGDNSGGAYVWVIPPAGGNPRKTPVSVGQLTNRGIIIEQGLTGEEQVATAAVHTLLEEMQVRPAVAGKEGLDG